MSALDRLIPNPRLLEIDRVDLAVPASTVWELVRHGALAQSRVIRALFALRTLVSRPRDSRHNCRAGHPRWRRCDSFKYAEYSRSPRLASGAPRSGIYATYHAAGTLASRSTAGNGASPTIRIDDLKSSPERPGFQILVDNPPHEVAVAAIGKVWHLDIPFVHVRTVDEYARYAEPDLIKVAWAIRVSPRDEHHSHVEFELRVQPTDEAAWRKFRRYFRLIGPFSRRIRRSLLKALARDLGTPARTEQRLPGDDLVPDAADQVTDAIDIGATPQAIWPWLVQMGCGRAGYYSLDLLDNGGAPSAREIHRDRQELAVGDVIPATPKGSDGFEVLRIEAPRVLVLGGLFDPDRHRQLAFTAPRPPRYWHVTWAFVLDPLDERSTRLHVRARVAFPARGRFHAAWIRRVHRVMQAVQLRNVAARAEGRLSPDGWRDVLDGISGALKIGFTLATPFVRNRRRHWGLEQAAAARALPGDDLIRQPRWSWTHAIEIEARADDVWPWVVQLGADRAGFYSYQWLENLAGCRLRNAETIHPEWSVEVGRGLALHPAIPPLSIVSMERGRHFVAHAPADRSAKADGKPWIAASWLFLVEPLGPNCCRLVSRYRVACSNDWKTRLSFGPTFVEAIGFNMDRRMLLGIKQRVEAARRRALAA